MQTTNVVITGLGPMTAQVQLANELLDPRIKIENWFTPEEYLGNRGFKYYSHATQLLLAATLVALNDADLNLEAYYHNDKCGIAVGSNFAVTSLLDEFDNTLLEVGSESISPMLAPSFSINLPASIVAIKQCCQCVNLTFTDPLIAGLHAFQAGVNYIKTGKADCMLVGATEGIIPKNIYKQIGLPDEPSTGAAMLVLESEVNAIKRGAKIYARVGDSYNQFNSNPEDISKIEYFYETHKKQIAQDHIMTPKNKMSNVSAQQLQCPYQSYELMSVTPMLMLMRLALAGEGFLFCPTPFGHQVVLQLLK